MDQKKNDEKIGTNELLFDEEVKDDELHSKLGVDDHIYIESERSITGRITFLIVLSIILILISLMSAIFGFVFKDSEYGKRDIGVNVTEYNLYVTHSNNTYGGEINSFANHNSLDKAYSYSFYVSNDNPANLNYSVDLTNLKYDSNNIDMSLIRYSLIKNGEVVAEGNLSDSMTNEIYDTKISSDTIDKYEIKIWSNNITKKVNFVFKINIRV